MKVLDNCITVTFKARVRAGRLVLDEPVDLPEGTEVDLVPAEDDQDLDDEDRQRLHSAIHRASDEFRQGRGIPAAEVLRRGQG